MTTLLVAKVGATSYFYSKCRMVLFHALPIWKVNTSNICNEYQDEVLQPCHFQEMHHFTWSIISYFCIKIKHYKRKPTFLCVTGNNTMNNLPGIILVLFVLFFMKNHASELRKWKKKCIPFFLINFFSIIHTRLPPKWS